MTSSGKDLNTDLTVNGLEPNTYYILEVMAYNGAGLGVPAIENWKTINAGNQLPLSIHTRQRFSKDRILRTV